MAFIQPCFIRKNTPELINKLERIGYVKSIIYKENEHNLYIGGDTYSSANFIDEYYYDCGTNEELFLALAALRDDTDKNQWFIYNTINNTVGKFETIEWVLCKDNNICDYLNWDNCYKYCHKAIVEEIVEHFKKFR